MTDSAISKEIIQIFIDTIREEKIIDDNAVLEKFSTLLNYDKTPTVKELKQALFNEDVS